ncbi:MAG: hypothetical protein K2X87_26715 [Gemmataceae bacterium]|nr:hypothetical protein [Gemmataceae bacterium]
MLEHRFRDRLTAGPAVATPPSPVAFVPCPVLAGFPPGHQALVAEVYRLAREMTAAQLDARRPIRAFPPAFSFN